MCKISACAFFLLLAAIPGLAQTPAVDGDFNLALPSHQGQLMWHADGFKITQNSAKPSGSEIGYRGSDASGQFTFLGFLFLFPEQAPMTSAKCRDGVMEPAKKSNPSIRIVVSSEMERPDGAPLDLVAYIAQGRDGKLIYSMRGFIATGDICGDLEVYGNDVSVVSDPNLKKMWDSYRFDPSYTPRLRDFLLYAQVLYKDQKYQAAAPMFEQALTKLEGDKDWDQVKWRRVISDQAGMAYGISGNIPKARALFEAAIAKDPDYPMYYYNLACADAEEKKLTDARTHLQQAFTRKANVIQGETLPDPAKDDSFLPYRDNKEFWSFVETLH